MNAASKERIAILLSSLGGEVAGGVLQKLPKQLAASMSSTLRDFEKIPPSESEVTDVLEEFNRFMEFALANSEEAVNGANAESTTTGSPEFISTGDPFEDLATLQDYQIAGVLRHENGLTCSVVISQLPTERAGKIMSLLPEEVRKLAFLKLQAPPNLPPPLLTKIIQSTVDKASLLDHTAVSDPDNLADEKTATLLRSMDRTTRTEMFAALESATPEVAERVKGLLFVFDDILMLVDKSIQKLLAEVDKSDLAVSLKNADPQIVDRITSNLSKRAKAGLLEEIEFLEAMSKDAETEARKKICDALAKLDQAGDLNMIEA